MLPRLSRRTALVPTAALIATATALATTGDLAPARAARRAAAPAVTEVNLLRNPDARAGAASIGGWDAVTIPGWSVARGLPTVVPAGTRGFPVRGPRMFVGGAGGTARLVQSVPLRPASRSAARFTLSGRLGASSTSASSLTVSFLSRSGRRLSAGTLGPVSGSARNAVRRLVARTHQGRVPRGAVRAEVTLTLATRLHNIDGPYAPRVGYDRAVAADLSLTVDGRVHPAPALRPPVSGVPRYRHVFLFYFENQDVRDVVGNRSQAPYYNRLLAQGSELGQMYAEEHPSDGNYLALAGGSVFGIPLDDPAEENSQYTIRAANIGDRIDAAGETWAAYEQSATGPCDDTVHGYYWDDDLPMMYFADVRDRPAYCAAHVLPLEAMGTDLAQASTTPNFSWVGINDCDDMEGCGIRAGDRFLAQQLGQIMRSPAWREQRSMAIITFDEDATDHERPAQRIPTLILASQGVRHGFVSHRRYTHYSLLRTIEGALGLRPLTANDRYAEPLNDVFRRGAPAAVAPLSPYVHPQASVRRAPAPGARTTPSARTTPTARTGRGAAPQTAFVVSSTTDRVTPITLANGRRGGPIPVGADPDAIALSPDDRTAYVVDSGSDDVTPIDTRTRREERPIPVGHDPIAIAIAPDGSTAYVSNMLSDSVTPIDLHTGRPLASIPVGAQPRALAFSADGRTLYVCDWGGGEVTPIDVATGQALTPIPVGAYPTAITVARRGTEAVVANSGSNTVTEIDTRTGRAVRSAPAGQFPDSLALTPNGRTVAVVDGDTDQLTVLPTNRSGSQRRIKVGNSPVAVTLSASGRTAYVANSISSTVTPVDLKSGRAGRPVGVGGYTYPSAITVAPGGRAAVVLEAYAGAVRLLWTRTRVVSTAIHVGGYPSAVAVTR
ncbi:MAG TPA: alkaline phosphatase family protein [Solirubrobacteraceae bacterium]|nr:alkaline phosphatase family protein [Solirubrobacteraceae bacterium]